VIDPDGPHRLEPYEVVAATLADEEALDFLSFNGLIVFRQATAFYGFPAAMTPHTRCYFHEDN
jgi:hypothetical protein